MTQRANVKTLAILQESRVALVEFGEEVRVALSMARSDMQKLIDRLQGELADHWKQQLRRWEKKLAEARTDLYRAQLQTQDLRQKPVEQMRMVQRAEQHVDQAQQKLAHIERWVRELEREMLLCKGQLQGLDQAVQVDLPRTLARLDQSMNELEAYIKLAPPILKDPITSATPDAPPSTLHSPASKRPSDAAPKAVPAFALAAHQRDAAIAQQQTIDPTAANWTLHPSDAAQLENLSLPIDPPFPEDLLLIEADTLATDTICLHRLEKTSASDSGWLIVPAGRTAPPPLNQFKVITFSQFVRACKALERLIILPRGMTIKLKQGRIKQIQNANGRSLWQTADDQA